MALFWDASETDLHIIHTARRQLGCNCNCFNCFKYALVSIKHLDNQTELAVVVVRGPERTCCRVFGIPSGMCDIWMGICVVEDLIN